MWPRETRKGKSCSIPLPHGNFMWTIISKAAGDCNNWDWIKSLLEVKHTVLSHPRRLSGKESACQCRRCGVWSLGMEDLLEEMATHSSILAWEIPRIEEPDGLPSIRLHRAGHDWVSEHTYMHMVFSKKKWMHSFFCENYQFVLSDVLEEKYCWKGDMGFYTCEMLTLKKDYFKDRFGQKVLP